VSALTLSERQELEALRVEVRELREEVEAWRTYDPADLAGDIYWDQIDALRRRLRCPPRISRLLIGMAKTPDRVVGKAAVLKLMGAGEEVFENGARVAITTARNALGAIGYDGVLETVWGRGYRLTPNGAAYINGVIACARRDAA
jgi:DNA-binding response OmpR family regulator